MMKLTESSNVYNYLLYNVLSVSVQNKLTLKLQKIHLKNTNNSYHIRYTDIIILWV